MRFNNPGLITLDEKASGSRPKFIVHFLKAVDPNNPDTTDYVFKEHTRPETFSYKDGRGDYLRDQLATGQVKMGYFEVHEKYGLQLKSVVQADDRLVSARDYFDGHEEVPVREGVSVPDQPTSVGGQETAAMTGKLKMEDLECNPGTGIWSYTLDGEHSSIEDPEINKVVSDLDERFRANRLLQQKAANPPDCYQSDPVPNPTLLGRSAELVPMPNWKGIPGLAAATVVALMRLLAIMAIVAQRMFQGQGTNTPQSAVANPTANKAPLTKDFLNQEEAMELESIPHIDRLEISAQGIDADFTDFQSAPMLQDKETRKLAGRVHDYLVGMHEKVTPIDLEAPQKAPEPSPSHTCPGPEELLTTLNGKPYSPEATPATEWEEAPSGNMQPESVSMDMSAEPASRAEEPCGDPVPPPQEPSEMPEAANIEEEMPGNFVQYDGEEVEEIIEIPPELLGENPPVDELPSSPVLEAPVPPPPATETDLFESLRFEDHQRDVDRIEKPLEALREHGIRGRAIEGKEASLLAYSLNSIPLPDALNEQQTMIEGMVVTVAGCDSEVAVSGHALFAQENLPTEKGALVLMPPKTGCGVYAYQLELNDDLTSPTYQDELTERVNSIQEAIKAGQSQSVREWEGKGQSQQHPQEEPNGKDPEITGERVSEEEEEQNAGISIDM